MNELNGVNDVNSLHDAASADIAQAALANDVDIQALAAAILALMKRELRIERERLGAHLPR